MFNNNNEESDRHMKKIKAFQTTSGKLYEDREQYVRAELGEMIGKTADGKPLENLDDVLDAIFAYRGAIVDLLHVRKPRGANKPKVAA